MTNENGMQRQEFRISETDHNPSKFLKLWIFKLNNMYFWQTQSHFQVYTTTPIMPLVFWLALLDEYSNVRFVSFPFLCLSWIGSLDSIVSLANKYNNKRFFCMHGMNTFSWKIVFVSVVDRTSQETKGMNRCKVNRP